MSDIGLRSFIFQVFVTHDEDIIRFKRDEGGLAKKGDMDTYALFRGKCYRRICESLGTQGIPLTTTTFRAYNDRQLCPNKP